MRPGRALLLPGREPAWLRGERTRLPEQVLPLLAVRVVRFRPGRGVFWTSAEAACYRPGHTSVALQGFFLARPASVEVHLPSPTLPHCQGPWAFAPSHFPQLAPSPPDRNGFLRSWAGLAGSPHCINTPAA